MVDFKDQVVIVTGAGAGIGRVYSLYYAKLGARVVVNDVTEKNARQVVDEIQKAGGQAIVAVGSVTDGAQQIVQTALSKWGKVDILLNNAGIIRDKSFKKMTDQEWDLVILVHLKGAFAMSKAVWPIFRQQQHGKIVNTASAAGLYGNVGQANYSAAKMGLIGFTKTLAREGAKYGICVNVIAPMAATQMLATVLPQEMLDSLKPEFVAPLVGVLTLPSSKVSGRIFEVGAGFVAEVRWERSRGQVFRTDESFTPSAVWEKIGAVGDWEGAEHPEGMTDKDMMAVLSSAKSLPANPQSKSPISFKGQTIVITGAGAGLGRAYALMFAKLGGGVVVNDVSEKGANAVVEEVQKAGGKAIACVSSAEDASTIVSTALSAPWNSAKKIDVFIANAGILRDKSFVSMTDAEWDAVLAVHLRATFRGVQGVWEGMQKNGGGRIITTCSGVGIYGNFGQANYSTAKAAILGLSRTLAIEGVKYDIKVNCIAPSAGTAMTSTIWPQEMVDAFKPDYVAPLVGYLASKECESTGELFEVSGGWAAKVRWERSGGFGFPNDKFYTAEQILEKWNLITAFDDGRTTHPTSTQEAMQQVVENFDNKAGSTTSSDDDPDDPDLVREAKRNVPPAEEFTYAEKDVILYNLGVGATEKELQWTYEGHEAFEALPTFGVIPGFGAGGGLSFDWIPNFNPAKLLHGEQYLKIFEDIPTSGVIVSQARVLEVLDKGKSASVTMATEGIDKSTGNKLFENHSTVVLRGSGGFQGKTKGSDRGPATAANKPPARKADRVVEEKTDERQAAVYRLSGDLNPLHLDPEFAQMGGFEKPILHGLCFMGIAAKHVYKSFGPFEDIKVRFAGVVYPGETLVTEMWKEGGKVVFTCKVKERDAPCLAAAAVTLKQGGPVKAKL